MSRRACTYRRKPRTKAKGRSRRWQPCTQQSTVASFLLKITFLLIPASVPGEAGQAGGYDVDERRPQSLPTGGLSPICAEGTGWGQAHLTQFPCSWERSQPAQPSLGTEMINEQPRRAVKMKNVLAAPGINHHLMLVPYLCGDLITHRWRTAAPAPRPSLWGRASVENKALLRSSRKALAAFSHEKEQKQPRMETASQVLRPHSERQKWLFVCGSKNRIDPVCPWAGWKCPWPHREPSQRGQEGAWTLPDLFPTLSSS